MKSYILPIIFLFSFSFLPGQNAVEDVLYLIEKGYVKPSKDNPDKWNILDDPEVYKILIKYVPEYKNSDKEIPPNQIAKKFKDSANPFICDKCKVKLNQPDNSSPKVAGGGGSGRDGVFGNIGNLNVTNLADGLAKFLVKRTKEELTIAFFNRFKEALDKHKEFKTLFPKTYAEFQLIDNRIYQINDYLESLRSAYIQDFKSFPGHLGDYLKDLDKPMFKDTNKWIQYLIPELLTVTQMGIDGTHPAAIIDYLADGVDYSRTLELSTIEGPLKTIKLLSHALKSGEEEEIWVKPKLITKLLTKEPAFQIFLGLLYQSQLEEIEKIKYIKLKKATVKKPVYDPVQKKMVNVDSFIFIVDKTITLKDLLTSGTTDKVLKLKHHIHNLASLGMNFDESLKTLDQGDKVDKEVRIEALYNVVNSMIDIVEESFDIEKTLTGEDLTSVEKRMLKIFRLINEITLDIRMKNYSSAIIKTTQLLEEILTETNFKFKERFLKFGSFMAAIAKAETSDEVATIIESFALPVGSASIKKQSKFNLALNAYVGGFAGGENLKDINDGIGKFTAGISAPIGIAASWGNGMDTTAWSFSIYGSLVDIGAITAYRFKDNNTETLPEVKLKNIFAPGLFLVVGVKNLPISIGAGIQGGPNLREVNGAPATSGFRYGGFISVDIPIINFYNKPK